MEEHVELLIGLDSGETVPGYVVNWAVELLERGFDTSGLIELAWLNKPTREEATELFINSLKELNLAIPTVPERKRLLAKRIASQILDGARKPNEGCSAIAEISRELDSPQDLSIFELLAHEQYDHESLGITAENIRPSIIEEARRLLTET